MTERFIHDPNLRPGDITILLDTGSLGAESEDGMKKQLLSDPGLSLVFKIGRHVGFADAERLYREVAPRSSLDDVVFDQTIHGQGWQ
jgi:hypothetical protein